MGVKNEVMGAGIKMMGWGGEGQVQDPAAGVGDIMKGTRQESPAPRSPA